MPNVKQAFATDFRSPASLLQLLISLPAPRVYSTTCVHGMRPESDSMLRHFQNTSVGPGLADLVIKNYGYDHSGLLKRRFKGLDLQKH
jgi:hypothetical protein